MASASEDFMKLRSGYLFPEVARRIRAWQERNPGASVLRLSIGNTTEPSTPHIAAAMREKVDQLTRRESYTGYGDEQGDTALREALSIHYREECGVKLPSSAFFISDGAKSDAANIQSIFSHSSIPAVQDPAYPVYVDSNVAGGHTGGYDEESEGYSGIVLMEYDGMTAEAVYSKIAASVNPSVLQGEDGSIMIDYVSKPETISLRLREGSRDTLEGGKIERLPFTPVKNNMIFEIQEFLKLVEKKEADHKYLKHSLDTIRVLDEVRRQTGIRF